MNNNNNSTPPIQFSPMPNIEQDNIDNFSDQKIADEALMHLDELSIYLNDIYHHSADRIFEYSHKQTLCNMFNLSNEVLNENELIKFIQPLLYLKNIKRINILGGNIFLNSSFIKVFNAFESLNGFCQFCLYLNYFDIEPYLNYINKIKSFNNLKFIFCITSKTNLNEIKTILNYFTINEIKFNCLIESEADVNYFESLLDNKVSKLFTPIYNGNNYNFFSENVFLEKEDIHSIIINQNEVFSRMKLNTNNYGKLTILSNGEVYSNINKLSVGNIKTNNISEIVFNEIKHKNNWLLTRNDVAPCSNCNYNFLCPPISNYEFVLNKFNLCHIKK
ncbi:MAG: hypothetical protein JEZ09_07965 [Salinivirgaceae bacterium]|nr:hypothetical protein [Salinivirgaceae bacterium]